MRKKKNQYKMPTHMRVAITFFLLWMAFVGYRNEQKAEEGDSSATSIKRYEVIQQFADIDSWRKIANPSYNQEIQFEDYRVGTGDQAACGQTVTVKSTHVPPEGEEPNPALAKNDPVHFTIGDGTALPAWDRGVRGMREGGVRRIWAGARLVNPADENLKAPDVLFDLELQTLSPNVPADVMAFSYETDRKAEHPYGHPLDCGHKAKIAVKLWNAAGEMIYEKPESDPLELTVGKSEYGHGIDRGLIGMYPLETRRMTIPPAYQAKKGAIPFKTGEIAIVEAKRLPYNEEPDAEQPVSDQPELGLPPVPPVETDKEPDHEPDSQPPERDQTLPDDGGDSQGGGT